MTTVDGWTPPPVQLPPDTFATRLRRIRGHLDLTVDEIAPMCGISVATWRSWEEKGSRPRAMDRVVHHIVDATRCDGAWLMWGDDRPGGPGLAVTSTRRFRVAS